MNKICIGTRGSRLALWQAAYIEQLLRQSVPGLETELVIIKTEGDRDQKSSLTQIGGQGVFTKAIEDALLADKIDIAVHSLKDLPSAMTPDLKLAAVPQRGPVNDVLVTPQGISFNNLPKGARIATGSIRRRSQLLNQRPDLQTSDLRGNIHTRLAKMDSQNLDGIIMARAAVERLALTQVKFYSFTVKEMVPAVGQGAVGVQTRAEDDSANTAAAKINHLQTFRAVTAERAFLKELDSGCQFPVGACAVVKDNDLSILGFVGSEDGREVYKKEIQGSADNPENLGRDLARYFIEMGADKLLRPEN